MIKKFNQCLIFIMLLTFCVFVNIYAKDISSLNSKKTISSIKTEDIKPIHEYNFDNDSMLNSTVIDTGSNKSSFSNGNSMATKICSEDGRIFRHFDNNFNSTISFSDYIIPNKNFSIKFDIRFPKSLDGSYSILSSGDNGISCTLAQDKKLVFSFKKDGYETAWVSVNASNYMDAKWHTVLFTYSDNKILNGLKLYVDDLVNPAAQGTQNTSLEPAQNIPITLGCGDFDLDTFQIYNKVLDYNTNNQIK